MRRNTVRLLKYMVVVVICFTVGPGLVKYLLGEQSGDFNEQAQAPRGLPVEPKDHHVQNDPKEKKKIDWHNYKQITEDNGREGAGEHGAAVILAADEEAKKHDLYKVNGFNAFASDKISLDRSLKDIRHHDCTRKKYWNALPTASIVIPFHNEHWTTLLRSVHSILNRSPPELLQEIILADDFSNKEFLGQQLDEHLAANYGGKVRVVRAQQREGLIRTRLLGAKAATGDVLIFLDSHIEANINWLPPLLDPIAEDYRTVVCPFIDVIDYETFAYRAQDEGARGAFDWEFFYKRLPLTEDDLKHPSEPFKSPVMAGGLFAISSKWFWELGGYDPGLDIWGGEQYELSFKLWQCGGMMLDAPCSRVAHIYRKFAPFPNPGVGDFVGRIWQCGGEMVDAPCSRVGHVYRKFSPNANAGKGNYVAKVWQCGGIMLDAPCSRVGHVYRKFAPHSNAGKGNYMAKNYKRVAEVWMDEYAEYLYKRRPHYRTIDAGDISEQKAIRTKLNCKSFKWFMTEVAFDLPKHYPPVEPPNMAEGELRNLGNNMCVDTKFRGANDKFGLETCNTDKPVGGEQKLELSWHHDIRPHKRSVCFDASQSIPKAPVILYQCHGMKGNQHFKYNPETNQLFHPVSNQCLDCDEQQKEVFMMHCDSSSASQKWQWEKMNTTLIEQEWRSRE